MAWVRGLCGLAVFDCVAIRIRRAYVLLGLTSQDITVLQSGEDSTRDANDLGRTFASWKLQPGVPTFTVAKMMGHSSTKTVERVYGHLSNDNLYEAARLVPQAGLKRVK